SRYRRRLNGGIARPYTRAVPTHSEEAKPMRCAACDADNPATAKFCNACGARLGVACSRCGHINNPGSRFCTDCGGQLAAPARAGHAEQRPSTYTPPHLAEKILACRGALEG